MPPSGGSHLKEGDRGLLKKLFRKPKNYYKGGIETMKNLKKVLAFVVACSMVFGMVAAAAGTGYPDVAEDATYAEAVKVLSALDIIQGDENGNFNPDATITRAEMATILCTMVASGELSPTDCGFTDVAADHWASGYIAYARQLGYIDGYDESTFGPEDPVTYEQVIKLIMAALGYTYYANMSGGYPAGYILAAAEQEVTNGVYGKIGEPAPRSTVAMLVYNALNAPVMERATVGTETTYQVQDGTNNKPFKTTLTNKLKTFKVEGMVTNSYKQDADMRDGYIDYKITRTLNIDVERELDASAILNESNQVVGYSLTNMDASGTDAADLFAYNSVAYIKRLDNGDNKVVAIASKASRNVTYEIPDVSQVYDPEKDGSVRDADKFDLTGADGKDRIFSYWNDRDSETRITTKEVSPNAMMLYNSRAYDTVPAVGVADMDEVVPERGNIKLVDTDNDGMIDLIEVKAYDVAVVDTVNADRNRITLKSEKTRSTKDDIGRLRSTISFNTDENRNLKETSLTLDGEAIELADLQEYDVLNICTNNYDDPTFFEIIVTRNAIEGEVGETTVDSCFIDGEEYKMTKGMGIDLPEVQDSGTFYLDADGRIAYVSTSSTVTGDYAFLYKVATTNMDGYNLKLMDKDGNEVVYDSFASSFRINDVSTSGMEKPYTKAQVNEIFGLDSDSTVIYPEGTDLTQTAVLTDIYTEFGGGRTGAEALTPYILLESVTVKGIKGVSTAGFVFTDAVADLLTGNDSFSDRAASCFVSISASDTRLNGITLPLAKYASNDKEFGFASSAENVEWQASIGKFEASKSLSANAKLFFVGGDETTDIADYSVKDISGLKDGQEYTPYFYAYSDDGMQVAVFFDTTSSIITSDALSIFDRYTIGSEDGDRVYKLYYWTDGVAVADPYVVDSEAFNEVEAMSKGDAFMVGKDEQGRVDKILTIFKTGTAPYAYDDETGLLDPSGDLLDAITPEVKAMTNDFLVSGNNSDTGNPDNEIYFGYIARVNSASDGVKLTLIGADGNYDNNQMFNVPSSAKVVEVNLAASERNQLVECTPGDIMASSYIKVSDSNNIDFAETEASEMTYAFVRSYKGEVTEVIYVHYFDY